MKEPLFEIEDKNDKKDCEYTCRDCRFYNIVMGDKTVCEYWLVGFDMRGLMICEMFKLRG